MSKFCGNLCPFCKTGFKENDDVVVCPDCGTPHHRSCYTDNKNCVNIGLHSSGFIWENTVEKAVADIIEADREREEQEARWQAFTETHGKNMDSERLDSFKKFFDTVEKRRENLEKTRERFEERNIYGVSEHEIVSFQSTGNPFSVERYRKIAASRTPVSFNILAGFLCPIYSFYFRANPIGIVLAAIDFTLRIPYTLLLFYNFSIYSNSEALKLLQEFYDSRITEISFLTLAIVVLTSIFFDFFYLKWMTAKIKSIRSRFEENLGDGETLGNDYYHELSRVGRPRLIKGFVDYLLTWLVLSILLFIVLGMVGAS